MTDIVLFGAGQAAEVAAVYIEKHSDLRLVAFTVDGEFRQAQRFRGLPVVAWEELECDYPPEQVMLLGPISYIRLNKFRRERYLEGKQRGYRFASFIHPDCNILTDAIGENCFILERNIIQPFARVGNNVIMWSGNHIGHHVTIGDHCFITSQVGIAGATRIGEGCFLGGQSGVIENLVVGDGCLIGAGALVSKSVPANSVVFGPRTEASPLTPSLLQRLS